MTARKFCQTRLIRQEADMQIFWVIITIVIISTVVGAVAKLLNNLNELNAARPNRGAGAGGGGGGSPVLKQANSDMDRFLAEIDRLRKKTADAPAPPQNQRATVPVAQPEKRPDRPKQRVRATEVTDMGFAQTVPDATTGPKAGDLPMASVISPYAAAANAHSYNNNANNAPAPRVTRFVARPRPIAKTPFAKSLTSLLCSPNGLAMAIVLQEILGPPKSRKKPNSGRQVFPPTVG